MGKIDLVTLHWRCAWRERTTCAAPHIHRASNLALDCHYFRFAFFISIEIERNYMIRAEWNPVHAAISRHNAKVRTDGAAIRAVVVPWICMSAIVYHFHTSAYLSERTGRLIIYSAESHAFSIIGHVYPSFRRNFSHSTSAQSITSNRLGDTYVSHIILSVDILYVSFHGFHSTVAEMNFISK